MLQNHLTLDAWPVLCNPSGQVDFLRMLTVYTMLSGEEAQPNPTSLHGGNGSAGVVHRMLIPLSLCHIIEYLTNLFQEGKGYSTINMSHSMLSVTPPPIDGSVVEKHPPICCFMQGV